MLGVDGERSLPNTVFHEPVPSHVGACNRLEDSVGGRGQGQGPCPGPGQCPAGGSNVTVMVDSQGVASTASSAALKIATLRHPHSRPFYDAHHQCYPSGSLLRSSYLCFGPQRALGAPTQGSRAVLFDVYWWDPNYLVWCHLYHHAWSTLCLDHSQHHRV